MQTLAQNSGGFGVVLRGLAGTDPARSGCSGFRVSSFRVEGGAGTDPYIV